MRRHLAVIGCALAVLTAAPAQAFEIEVLRPTLIAKIDLSTQRMHVSINGKPTYTWPVSTGTVGYRTPTGTYKPYRLNRHWWSRQWDNAPMHYAMFFLRGYAVHATENPQTLGVPASHGCVRLHTANAATLFRLVQKHGAGRTRFTLYGEAPTYVSRATYRRTFTRHERRERRARRRAARGFAPYAN